MPDVLRIGLLYLLSLPVLLGSWQRMVLVVQSQGDVAGLSWLDLRYAQHPLLTALHLLPGVLFFLLGPMQFSASIRRRWRAFHRQSGRIFVLTGIVSGLAVLWTVLVFPAVGGRLTQTVTFALVGGMIALLLRAWAAARQKAFARHRAAMIRAYAIGLSVSTARIFIELAGIVFGLGFLDSFTAASAIGVTINLAVAEWVLRR